MIKLQTSMIGFVVAVGSWAAVSAPAASADLGTADASSIRHETGWTLSFTTYSWLPWLSGETAVRGRSFDVSATPKDILDALDWSQIPVWMSYTELRNGRLMLFNDIVYSKLSGSAGFERSRSGRLFSATVRGDVEADYEQAVIEVGAGYEIWSRGPAGTAGHSSIDVLGGARYWHQELDVSAAVSASATLNGPLGLVDLTRSGSRIFAKSGSVDWVDPFVGARLNYAVAAGQSFSFRGDIGGFGAGSDFSWQALAAYNWELCLSDTYALDAYVGYRALSVDYSEGSGRTRYEYNAVQHGPVLGATLRF